MLSILVVLQNSTRAEGIQATAEVDFLGTYSQLEETPEHVYGYILELWRDGESLVVRWSRARGTQADFPTVLTTRVEYNEGSGALHFTAAWCSDEETFEGVLKGRTATGTVRSMWANGTETASVVLTRIPDEDEILSNMPRADWKIRLDKIMRRLGPKCQPTPPSVGG
jgi:hypothetical protein